MADRNTEFSLYHFPVDVFWMDIPHTEDYKYFVYNTNSFTQEAVETMNQEVEAENRTLVVITDPQV